MPPLAPIALTRVDAEATGYATFQSHNQKLVETRHGLFAAYIRTRNADFTAQTWRLVRSTDGGRTFSTLYEAVHATNPPTLEADSRGNLYLIRVDLVSGDAALYIFQAERRFRDPRIILLPGGAAGKYAACLDERRNSLYFLAHSGRFFRVGLPEGAVERIELIKDGPDAHLQYPSLALDEAGRLHAAWTTVRRGEYLYWDIHHMLSEDGGHTWHNMGGGELDLPVVADQHGRALRITRDDEFAIHTWLSGFATAGGKAHFVYLAQSKPARQRYLRYDIATGKLEVDTSDTLRGGRIHIQSLDGLLTTDRGKLYCVGGDGGRLACLVSFDNGTTWREHARSEQRFTLYAIGGPRQAARSGEVIGMFTDYVEEAEGAARKPMVYFFRIPPAQNR